MDKPELKQDSNGFWYVEGDISYVKGDVWRVEGDVERVHGDVTYVKGDVTYVKGDVWQVKGNVECVDGDAGQRWEEAEAENRRLREALRSIAQEEDMMGFMYAARIAKAALEKENNDE